MIKRLLFILLAFLFISDVSSQAYKRVQVTLRDGNILKGKNGIITNESLTFTSESMQKTYALYDVNLVQAREGKTLKWALGCGGGCLGLGILTTILQAGQYNEISGETYSAGTLLAGSFIWAGVFAGAGALIGHLTDPWEIVYNRNMSSFLRNLDFNIGSNQAARINLTMAYKIPINKY
ncbi:MAG: hypothetical protein JXR52_12675 [Bacteroidales bacterium]|nr:hypothetical protein [Bacteroidales bacterium]